MITLIVSNTYTVVIHDNLYNSKFICNEHNATTNDGNSCPERRGGRVRPHVELWARRGQGQRLGRNININTCTININIIGISIIIVIIIIIIIIIIMIIICVCVYI